eukprot:gene11438-13518_t
MMLFKNGKEIESARKHISGYRTAAVLKPFVENYIGPSAANVTSADELEETVNEVGVVVVGLFESPDAEGVSAFKDNARQLRSHARFALVTAPAAAHVIAENFEVAEVPSVFALKSNSYIVPYEGKMSDKKALHAFMDFNSFPNVGNFSMLTFYRYKYRDSPQILLLHDQNGPDDDERFEEAKTALETVVTSGEHKYDGYSVMAVGSKASEEDGKQIIKKTGAATLEAWLPAIAIRKLNETGVYVMNQLVRPITPDFIEKSLMTFTRNKDRWTEKRCQVSKNSDRELHYTQEVLEEYDNYAQEQKRRFGLSDDLIREVDEASFKRQLKKSWKDVMVIYTARWCHHCIRVEEILHRMVRAGEFEDLDEELQIVKIDVVLTEAKDYNTLQMVPALKYISARYKDFPNWFGGEYDNADSLVNFVRSYHSMRHVEIPGEGTSPYSKKSESRSNLEEALSFASEEIVF